MTRTLFAVISVVLVTGASTLAHHSYGDFFRDKDVSIEGEIEALVYGNPHVVLNLRTRDLHTYTAEWGNVRQLCRAGVTSTTLKVGDLVIVTGSPARNPTDRRLALLREIRRPVDGWRWSKDQWLAAC